MHEFFSIHWRELVLSPERSLRVPLVSPFAENHNSNQRTYNLYADWVRLLQGAKSGVYWYGWQPADEEEPLFYIGRSIGNLYSTFVRHFSGVYSPVQGQAVPRSTVPRNRHHTVRACVVLTTQVSAPVLESRMIAFWSQGAFLENRYTSGIYDFTGFNIQDIEESNIDRAKRYLNYLRLVHGSSARSMKEYRKVAARVAELEFVPF